MSKIDFSTLVASINTTHTEFNKHTSRAINIGLTLRNWLIGYHIANYELYGADRAEYGEKLIDNLSSELKKLEISSCNRRELYRYLRFYRYYPQIVGTLSPQFKPLLEPLISTDEKVGTLPPQSINTHKQFVEVLSYSHIEQLVDIENETKRLFYEVECIRGSWSVRELRRQISSLYYERSGLSTDKNRLAELASTDVEANRPNLTVRDPYVFEFLGLKPQEVMSESHLEDQLLDGLQEFLLELGHGFCFEARQKRILIGDEYFFIDLVFYHRILKCHVLVELKLEEFNHTNIGQLNTYVNWYKGNMMEEGDNPPIGILLCTHKNHALAEYALAGMDNTLFVSKYQLELPSKEAMQEYIEGRIKNDEL